MPGMHGYYGMYPWMGDGMSGGLGGMMPGMSGGIGGMGSGMGIGKGGMLAVV